MLFFIIEIEKEYKKLELLFKNNSYLEITAQSIANNVQ